MAKVKDVTKSVVKRAKATAGRVGKQGKAAAKALVVKATDAVTGKAKRRKRVKVAVATAGAIVAAATVAAVGVRAAKSRRR